MGVLRNELHRSIFVNEWVKFGRITTRLKTTGTPAEGLIGDDAQGVSFVLWIFFYDEENPSIMCIIESKCLRNFEMMSLSIVSINSQVVGRVSQDHPGSCVWPTSLNRLDRGKARREKAILGAPHEGPGRRWCGSEQGGRNAGAEAEWERAAVVSSLGGLLPGSETQ